MYSSPEVSDHDMRNIRPPASVLLLQGSTTPPLKTSANSTDHNATAAAKGKLTSKHATVGFDIVDSFCNDLNLSESAM